MKGIITKVRSVLEVYNQRENIDMKNRISVRRKVRKRVTWKLVRSVYGTDIRMAERPRARDRRLDPPERQRVGVAREAGGGGERVDTATFPTILTRPASSHPPRSAAPEPRRPSPAIPQPLPRPPASQRLSVNRVQCPTTPCPFQPSPVALHVLE